MTQREPQYKNKGFKNEEELNAWLEFTTEAQIVFEDDGQDFLNWYVDRHGEVLHSDLQGVIWNGKMVDLRKIKIGEFLPLQDGTEIIHKVKKIIQFPFKNK